MHQTRDRRDHHHPPRPMIDHVLPVSSFMCARLIIWNHTPWANALLRSSHERRVANNLANLADVLESPRALFGIREGSIDIGVPLGNDRLASVIKDLATELLVLDQRANGQLDRLKRPLGSNGWLVLTLGSSEHRLRSSLGGLVAEGHADLISIGADLFEGGIADDGADFARVAQCPGAFVGVAEGDVGGVIALDDDGRAGMVEDLAAVILVLDGWPDGELDCFEGPVVGGGLRSALIFGEWVVGVDLVEVA